MPGRAKNPGRNGPLPYRPAEGVGRDPLRFIASFLVAFGVVGSLLVLADTIRYFQTPVPEELPAVNVGLTEIPADIHAQEEDEDRGEQKVDPEAQDEKTESVKKEEDQKDPPSEVVNKVDKPRGPALASDDSKQIPVISAHGGGGAPRAIYGNRGGDGMANALGKYGGGPRTQNAVKLGLAWLARHQEGNGSWSRTGFRRHCKPGKKCWGAGEFTVPLDPAITGLAMLCFQAAGNTHKDGEYKDNVLRAAKWMCKIQAKNGLFGKYPWAENQYMMYNQGIATFALAELYAMSEDPWLRPHVERAVQFIVTAQQLSGAWDYRNHKTGRFDTSVTGWQVMALKSAHAAGVKIPSYTIYKLARYIDRVTLPTGEVIYANKDPAPGRKGWGMVAVGLASGQFLGFARDSRIARRQTAVILSHPPKWERLRNVISFDSIYYWYYATIATFQVGGKPWERWNAAMKKTVLVHQRRGGCADGSWDPPRNFWSKIGGRMYATTLNILNLEIYYRYLPLYTGGTLDTAAALIRTIRVGQRVDAVQAVRLLGRLSDKKAREFLLKLAHGDDHQLALEASVTLAEQRDMGAVVPLLAQLRSANPYVRYRALGALAPMMGKGLERTFVKCLRDKSTMVARRAVRSLRQYAKVSFGFEPEVTGREREEAIGKWENWLEKREQGVAVQSSVPWLVVRVRAAKGQVAFHTGKAGLARAGQTYSIYRNDQYVGRILVSSVVDEIGIGKIIERDTAGAIKEGDVVRR